MKDYPLDVYSLGESGFYSKGIHDEKAFLKAIQEEYQTDVSKYRVCHSWVRMRPALPFEQEEYGKILFFADAKQGERGAFPITMTY